jgi:hypothetical protein
MTQEKDINYWKNNCEEDYMTTHISVLRYISELEKLVTSSQTEISDEEIEKAVNEYAEVYQCPSEVKMCKHDVISAWNNAIKWYREQLKCTENEEN